MPEEDFRQEGLYTRETVEKVWREINGDYDSDVVVWVVDFELLGGA